VYSGLSNETQGLLRVPTIPVIRAVIPYPAMVRLADAETTVALMPEQALAVLKDPEDVLDPNSALLQTLKNSRDYLLGDGAKPYTSWDDIFASDEQHKA